MQQTQTTYTLAPPTTLTVATAVERFLEQRRVSVSANTIERYASSLRVWLRWRDAAGYGALLSEVAIEEFRALMIYLKDEHVPHGTNTKRPATAPHLKPSSIDGIYRNVRTFWNFLDADELLSDRQARFFLHKRIARPRVPEHVRPAYGLHQLEQFLGACDNGREEETRLRNRAILLMLYETGARITEVCELEDSQVDLAERTGYVHGKGDKYRYVFWGVRTAAALDRYLTLRRGAESGPLFRGTGSKNSGGPLTGSALRDTLRRLAQQAGMELPEQAPVHAFRHAFARRALDLGMDGLHLQQILGHSSSRTTERYVRENPGPLRRIYRRVFDAE
jgi:site-specific recombinase XerD